jgi:organic radical activating enzyme
MWVPDSRAYLVKEMFGPTLQGEGAHAGRPCVFLRFAACNLECSWCDTDFAPEGATRHTADEIAARLVELDRHAARMVVVTGGEPTLQWDAPLADALHARGFRIHMESNGTRPLAGRVDWLTVSPKPQFHPASIHSALRPGVLRAPAEPGLAIALQPDLPVSELKVVVDDTVDEATLDGYSARYRCEQWFVQPCMNDRYDHHLARTLALVHARPRWRISLQLHKILGVP